MQQVIVIGAGIGGLSAAALLARRGFAVTVLERGSTLGGKVRAEDVGGAHVDVGPTVLTMRWALERVFDEAGLSLEKAVQLTRLTTLARHSWEDGAELDLFEDIDASAEAIARISDQRNADGYRAFAAHSKRIWELVREPFIESPRPTLTSMLGAAAKRPALLTQIDSTRTMWSALRSFFTDPRLLQLFGRYATYCGSSPFHAPGTLNCIAHVEREGVWSVSGGMRQLPQALARAAAANGAVLRVNAHVAQIVVSGGAVTGVRLADGEVLNAKHVVFNGDVAAIKDGLLGGAAQKQSVSTSPRSLSAVTVAGKFETKGRELLRHNVFFSDDYPREFDAIERGEVPSEPSVYVCAQDRELGSANKPGPERLFFIVNAPALGGQATSSEREQCEQNLFRVLEKHQLSCSSVGTTIVTTPADFAERFPGTGGALYGAATAGMWSSFSRAGSQSSIRGLYLAGGSVHPGSGVPMAALSGKLAADTISEGQRSTGLFRATGTLGGTWMR